VALHAPKKWAQVARAVPHRSDQQCRERWINVLDPGLKHGGWDAAEDDALRAAVAACTKPNGKVGCARRRAHPRGLRRSPGHAGKCRQMRRSRPAPGDALRRACAAGARAGRACLSRPPPGLG